SQLLIYIFISYFTLFLCALFKISANGLQLGEVAEIEAQMFKICTMFNRIPNVQISTEPAILPNCC
ncbi:hypothetical protein ACK1KB_13875, partial [Chryseobacterium sp. TY3]